MAVYINNKNPNSSELDDLLTNLSTCPGTCIFIDIVNSTEIKYRTDLKTWARMLNNTFNFISFLNDFPNHIVKGIGDELMLYIPDEDLHKKQNINNHYQLLQEIFATLFNIKHFPNGDMFLPCKVAIHYCTNVYNITYFENYDDYYGLDIDLTARLMSKARMHRIVFSESFYKKVLESCDGNEANGCLSSVSEKYIEDFKGVPYATELRVIDV
jgi:class 3 adenylate cyclase